MNANPSRTHTEEEGGTGAISQIVTRFESLVGGSLKLAVDHGRIAVAAGHSGRYRLLLSKAMFSAEIMFGSFAASLSTSTGEK